MKGEQNRITNGRLKLHSCGREIGQPEGEREGGRVGRRERGGMYAETGENVQQ